jgi:glycosyltransferase involved in cell wall biosynthesis
MTRPLVSVFIANYNHGKFLPKCFTGLLNQTYADLEVVMTDDGSTDGSPDLIRQYAKADSRIKANYFPKNRGVREAFSDSISRTTGKYIYCAGSDDFVVNKDFFQKAVDILEKDSRGAGYYGITGLYLSEKEKLTGAIGTAEVEGYNTPLQCCEGLLKYRSIVTSTSCIWRRDLFLKQGGNRMDLLIDAMGPQADYSLNHELAWRYGIFYEKIPLACQRIYEAKTNYSSNLDIFALAARLHQMEKRLREVGISYPAMENDWLRWRAINLLDSIKKSGVPI